MHKPQWNARKGTENEGYKRWVKSSFISVRNLPSRTTLKTRQIGQHSRDELRERDYKKELQEKEAQHQVNAGRSSSSAIAAIEHAAAADDVDRLPLGKKRAMEEEEEEDGFSVEENKRAKYDGEDDEDDELAESDGSDSDLDSDSDSDDEDDDDDEDAELARELARIKQERHRQELLKEQEQRMQEQLSGNPLLMEESFEDDDLSSVTASMTSSATVKRKWNEDTIFRNQARDEVQPKKRFINDTLRSDFHKRFLQKYIK